MNAKQPICFSVSAMALLSFCCGLLASESQIELHVGQTRILPFEPVGVVLTISNTTDSAISKIGSKWSSFRIAKEENGLLGDWRTFQPNGLQITLPPPHKLNLAPNRAFTDFCLVHIGFDGNPVFQSSGVYCIQAGTPFGESDIVKIVVEEPMMAAKASKFLLETMLYRFFSDYSARSANIDSKTAPALMSAIADFKKMPESAPYKSWIPVCDFLLTEILKADSNALPIGDRARRTAHYAATAEALPSPQRENLLWAIASEQLADNDMNGAKASLLNLTKTAKDDYFIQLANYQLSLMDVEHPVR